MDYNEISPKYIMELVPKIEEVLWGMFEKSRYQNVRRYIEKWHEEYDGYNNWGENENFRIYFKNESNTEIDLGETLHKMPKDLLLKIAIDVGVDTPGFLPAIPTFKNVLKDYNQTAYQNFDRAIKNVYESPDQAVALASSALDGIIKTILKHESLSSKAAAIKNKALTKQVSAIIKEFGFDDKTTAPQEIITLASQLRGIGTVIDDLRSDKSTAHGKTDDDYVIDDSLWASFVVNTCATLGLFLWEYFEKKYKPALKNKKVVEETVTEDEPINLDDIPF
jgi:hypothetical protein